MRRRFTAAYKMRILKEADTCKRPGEIGALLRREGLYSSHLVTWRRQMKDGLVSKKRGRKKDPAGAEKLRIAELERENQRLRKQLSKAETIIEFQKKLSVLLETGEKPPESEVKGE